MDRVAARLVGLDVGEGAVDAVAAVGIGPLPPVDVARVAGSVRWDVGCVVGPEAQPLGAERRLGAREPLPLRGHGVVLRLGAVRHRRVPARLVAPAPAVAVVVLVVVGDEGAMVGEGRGRELEVGVASPGLAVQRRQRGHTGAAVVVEGAEEPQLVLDDRPAHRARGLPVLRDLARERVALAHVEERRPEVLSGGGLVAGDRAELGVDGRAAVERRCYRTWSGRRWPRRRSSRTRPSTRAPRSAPPRRRRS